MPIDEAPPPVFSPSTQGPSPAPMATPMLGQMAGMVPTPGQSPIALLKAAGDLLLQAARLAQGQGDTSLAPIVAQMLSLATDWSSQSLQQSSPQSSAGMPQMHSPLGMPPQMPGNGMSSPGMPPSA